MTLFTSVKEKTNVRVIERYQVGYLAAALFLVFFGAVYEHFSFGVYSAHMVYAFLYPLVLGMLPMMLLIFLRARRFPSRTVLRMMACAIFTLSVGSLLKGVLDIYGTENSLIQWFYYTGAGVYLFSIILNVIPLRVYGLEST